MIRNLEPFLPALNNTLVFVVALLLLLLVVAFSAASLWRGRNGQRLRVPKVVLAAVTFTVLGFWLVVGVGLIAFAGAVGGSTLLALLPPVLGVGLLVGLGWLFVAWAKNRPWADWTLSGLIIGALAIVVFAQRLWICEPLAWGGLIPAQMCTAELYARGEQGAIRSERAALGWYGQAARNGSEAAVYAIVDGTRNKIVQQRLLAQAAEAGNNAAGYQLYLLLGPEAGRVWLEQAISQGHPDAIYQQSRYVHAGQHGYSKDRQRGLALLREAAEQGSSAAAAELALAYERGDKLVGYSRARSRQWARAVSRDWPGSAEFLHALGKLQQLRDAADEGDPEARLKLARDFAQRARDDGEYALEAEQWFIKAADAGAVDAQFELAYRYFRDPDATAQQLELARGWLLAAADQDHRYALSNVAHYLSNGQYGYEVDLPQAHDRAARLVKLLQEQGLAHKRDYGLAVERLARIGALRNEQEAWLAGLSDLRQRAAAGDAQAKYQLFVKHSQHPARGDRRVAWALLEEAAELGHVEARYRVAFRTLTQPRTDAAEARAYVWMQDAAGRGHRGAMVFMANTHRRGLPKQGIAKDLDTAASLYRAALEGLQGDVVYQRKSGTMTVATTRAQVERALAELAAN